MFGLFFNYVIDDLSMFFKIKNCEVYFNIDWSMIFYFEKNKLKFRYVMCDLKFFLEICDSNGFYIKLDYVLEIMNN